MDPEKKAAAEGPTQKKPAADQQPPQERIPNSDMQPEDAGTSRSGNEDDDARASAAQSVAKQTSKTDTESGGKGR